MPKDTKLQTLLKAARQSGRLYPVLNELRARHASDAKSTMLIANLDQTAAELQELLLAALELSTDNNQPQTQGA